MSYASLACPASPAFHIDPAFRHAAIRVARAGLAAFGFAAGSVSAAACVWILLASPAFLG